jgi:hypothetical protein
LASPAEEAVGRSSASVSVAEMAGLLAGRGSPTRLTVDRDAAGGPSRPGARPRVAVEAFFARSPSRGDLVPSPEAAGTFTLSGLAFNQRPRGG